MDTVQAPNGTHEFHIYSNMVLVVRDNTVLLTLTPDDYYIVIAAEMEAARERIAS